MKWLEVMTYQLDLAGFILISILAVMIWTLVLAQRDAEFDIKQAMVDDLGKVSFLRLCGLGGFAVSSWVVMKDTLSGGGANPVIFGIYIAIWSGAPLAGKLLEVIAAWKQSKSTEVKQ